MPTTIDTLQIEIQSSSTNAAKGIEDLASSLGKLKSNGSFKTAVTNLTSLRNALHALVNVPTNASKISSLANSLEKLKGVGSISSVGTSIGKLANSLKELDKVDVSTVAPQIQRIANAVAPLSTLKAGGLNTMVNALSKIGKVTADLDDQKIAAFASRISKLNEVLTPLSTKMTTIQAGLRGINSSARSAGSGVKEMGEHVNATTLNFSSLIHVVQTATQALQGAVERFSNFVSQAIEWDGISSRFGRGFGAQAQETYDWIQRLNQEMGINVQQFMQYSSIYSNMLTGFGVAVEDATEMALGYTELTYDIWAGYNDIYKTYEEAADAVKSAIAGEVEPIRRAGFTIVEATLEQTAANHGLEISIYNATEAQKSYLRYLTLIDQAHAQGLVGTYAKELQTAEGLMRTLSQQLKSLAQAFGSLFLPFLVEVVPYLQAFVELLAEAVHWVAALFGIEIQGVDWSSYNEGSDAIGGVTDSAGEATDALGSAAQAAKDLKKATLGIDELNVISPPSASGGSGGAGGTGGTGFEDLDVDSLWDESVFAEIGNQVDAIKQKIQDWMPVIGTVAAALGALSVGILLAQLGESMEEIGKMEGLLGGLKKTLAGLTILTIEAALVFTLADAYLDSGNFLALIGEALATAAGGYLMYKGFGTKGLVMSLAVSVLAQLAAITMNVADGTVDVDDPELWFQTAMTTLTGAAGGLFAFKKIANIGAGKGALLGATATLSLSLAGITIGGVAEDGFDLQDGLTGALSTALGGATGAGLFSLLGIASGGVGFLVGGAIMLAVNVIGAIVASVSQSVEKSLEEDLNSRFGNVELTLSEVKVVIDKLSPEWTEGVQDAAGMYEGLEMLKSSIESSVETLNAYNWRVSVGIQLDEEEQGAYKSAVDRFVSMCQQYVNDRGYALEVGLKATGASIEAIEASNFISAEASATLASLGSKLQETVNAAFEDGLLDIDEQKAIQTIQQDMLEIQEALSSGKVEAEFSMLEMKWSGVDLTPESFNTMMDEWKSTIEDEIKPALEATVNENLNALHGNIAFAKLQYEKAGTAEEKAKWADAIKDAEAALQSYIDENPLENLTADASFQAVNFALNTLEDLFAKELEVARSAGWFDYKTQLDLSLDLNPYLVNEEGLYGNIEGVVLRISEQMNSATYNLPSEARANLEKMVESLKPTMEDYEEIAAANRKAGTSVTESIRDGLNDYNELAAIAGDTDAINYMIGKGFSTDQTFLNTLATAENAGSQIDASVAKGLLNNIEYVKDEASGVVTGIKNTVTGDVIQMTPTLKKNLEELGVNLSEGLAEGVKKDKPTLFERFKSWSDGIVEKVKGFFGVHSPSKVFMGIGEQLSAGLSKGMESNSLKDRLSTMWTSAKNWWKKKPALSTYTPSIGSIYEKLKARWDSARTWWNNKKTKAREYTPSIGSIYEKMRDRWNNARTWWNSKKPAAKTYTPSIGSIKSKLQSAWNTAKSWWSKNVRLSIPSLNFKVTYSTKGLNMAQKAVVKALGMSGWPKLSFAANGGMFDMGSLIWAGERGAEVVANAGGGRTGVMNVAQMQDAVYEGVYAAVMAAMKASNGGGSQDVNVYLDGKQITAAVEKRQKERGTTIMGNQVYSY